MRPMELKEPVWPQWPQSETHGIAKADPSNHMHAPLI
uniref:Uncharacterized protein n=1 Tax=Rhizophora mucronata TaxID=61149 RepID=A0A2P2PVJ1_RHIMU